MRDKSVAPFFVGLRVDAQGGVLSSAQVTLSSPALIGGPANSVTNEKGSCDFRPPSLTMFDVRVSKTLVRGA